MAQLSPFAFYTVLDSNGDPIVGAKIESYVAGTSTALSTYSDEGLTTANANPASGATTGNQVSDASGRFGAMFLANAEYKFIIKDDGGVTIFTIDNVNADAESVVTAANIAAVQALPSSSLTANDLLFTLGGAATGDGYGGEYYWSASSTATDDSSDNVPTVIRPTDTGAGTAGRWLLRGVKDDGGDTVQSVQQHLADAHSNINASLNGWHVAQRIRASAGDAKATQLYVAADIMVAPAIETPIPWTAASENPYKMWVSPSYVLPVHALTAANPGVFTAYGAATSATLFSVSTSDVFRAEGLAGAVEANGVEFTIAAANATAGTITTGTNTSGYTAYTSGGWIAKGDPDIIKMARGIRRVRLRGSIPLDPNIGYVTNVTQANPAVVTIVGHTFANGMTVTFSDVAGMTDLNGNTYTVAGVSGNTFQLSGTNSTGFGAYTYGGVAVHTAGSTDTYGTASIVVSVKKVANNGTVTTVHTENFKGLGEDYPPVIEFETPVIDVEPRRDVPITGITLGATTTVNAPNHKFTVGKVIELRGIVGTTELNGTEVTVTAVTRDTFTFAVNSAAYTAYVSGGLANERPDYFRVFITHDKTGGLALQGGEKCYLECDVIQRDDDIEENWNWALYQGVVSTIEAREGGVQELAARLANYGTVTVSQSTTEGFGSLPNETSSGEFYNDILNGGASTRLLDGYNQGKYASYEALLRALRRDAPGTEVSIYMPGPVDAPAGTLAGQHYPSQTFAGDASTTAFTVTNPTSIPDGAGGSKSVAAPLIYFVASSATDNEYQPNFKFFWNGTFVGYNNLWAADTNTTVSASDDNPENATSFSTSLTGEAALDGVTYTVTVSGGTENGQAVANRYDTITISPAPPNGLDLRILYDVNVPEVPWSLVNNEPTNLRALIKKSDNRPMNAVFMDLATNQHLTTEVMSAVLRVCHEHGYNVIGNATVPTVSGVEFFLGNEEIRDGDGFVVEGFGIKLGSSSIADTQALLQVFANYRYKGVRLFGVIQELWTAGVSELAVPNVGADTDFDNALAEFEAVARPGDRICYSYSDLGTLTGYLNNVIYDGPNFTRVST